MKNNIIVILEKDFNIFESCKSLLKNKGYIVKSISDAQQVLNVFSDTPFQVLIIDSDSLKEGEIISFLKSIKKQRPVCFVVLIFSDVSVDTLVEVITAGADAVIKKPFALEQLISVIESYFQKLSLIEENIKINTLIPLYELTERFIMTESEDQVFQLLIKAIENHTGADRISIMTYDEEKGVLRIREAIGLDENIIKTTELKPGESISGWVFAKRKPVIIDGTDIVAEDFSEYYEIKPLLKKKDLVSMSIPLVCIPIYIRKKSLGVVNISKKKNSKPFTKSDMEMVFVICRQAALAIENIRSQKEREEKLRIKTILEQYVAPEIAEILISSGKDPMSLGEIKDVAILFADIKDFTLLVQKIPIRTTRDFLNEFFGLLTEAVFKFHGTLYKFIGDAALAIFGSPIHVEKPAYAAVSAALEIRVAFNRLRSRWEKQENVFQYIGIGIGVTSGKVFIGNVGTKKRLDFTVIGLDVNLAQRLASDAKNGDILISERVKEQLGSGFNLEQISSYHLKGIEKPVTIYAIK